ncbi:MAG: hypothetical protein ACREKM_10200, partial [Longimicrobiales bacterium]
AAPGEHVVAGVVRDEPGDPPVPHSPVFVEVRPGDPMQLETDAHGLFRICSVADGAMVILRVRTRRDGVRVYEIGPLHESMQVEVTLGNHY